MLYMVSRTSMIRNFVPGWKENKGKATQTNHTMSHYDFRVSHGSQKAMLKHHFSCGSCELQWTIWNMRMQIPSHNN